MTMALMLTSSDGEDIDLVVNDYDVGDDDTRVEIMLSTV